MSKYLYVAPSATNALTMPTDTLLSMDQTGANTILLTFQDKEGTVTVNTFVTLTINTGSFKEVMKNISEAIAFGKDQFIILADVVNSTFLNSDITGVGIDSGAITSRGVMSSGSGFVGNTYKSSVKAVGDLIETTIIVDLDDCASIATDAVVIGTGTSANAFVAVLDATVNGSVFHSCEVTCVELIEGGELDILLVGSATGTTAAQATVTSGDLLADFNGDTALGSQNRTGTNSAVAPTIAKPYLYFKNGHGTSTAATYTAGKFMIKIIGEL